MKPIWLRLLLIVVLGIASFSTATAQIFVLTNDGNGTVGSYGFDGQAINANLISGFGFPVDLTLSGTTLYVVDQNNPNTGGTIGSYNLNGTAINASLLTGLNYPNDIAVLGNYLYVTFGSYMNKYTLDGTLVADHFISQSAYDIIPYNSTLLFVDNSGDILQYNPDGTPVGSGVLVSGAANPGLSLNSLMTVVRGTLYVTNFTKGSVSAFSASDGSLISADYITGLEGPSGIAGDGDLTLFVTDNGTSALNTYYLSDPNGLPISTPFISNLNEVDGVAIYLAPGASDVPEPSSCLLLALGGLVLMTFLRTRSRFLR